MWKFVKIWVGVPLAVITLIAQAINLPKNWEIIVDVFPWLAEDLVRLLLGLASLAYLIWIARPFIKKRITKNQKILIPKLNKLSQRGDQISGDLQREGKNKESLKKLHKSIISWTQDVCVELKGNEWENFFGSATDIKAIAPEFTLLAIYLRERIDNLKKIVGFLGGNESKK